MTGCHYKKCLRAPHLFRQARCNPQLAFRHHYIQVPAATAKQCCSAPLGGNCLMVPNQPPAAGFQEQYFSQQNKKQAIVCFFFFFWSINKKKSYVITLEKPTLPSSCNETIMQPIVLCPYFPPSHNMNYQQSEIQIEPKENIQNVFSHGFTVNIIPLHHICLLLKQQQ